MMQWNQIFQTKFLACYYSETNIRSMIGIQIDSCGRSVTVRQIMPVGGVWGVLLRRGSWRDESTTYSVSSLHVRMPYQW